eukprot:gene127-22704_t
MLRLSDPARQLRDQLIVAQQTRKKCQQAVGAERARDAGKWQANITNAMMKLKSAWFGDRDKPAALAVVVDIVLMVLPQAAASLRLNRCPAIAAAIMTAPPPANGQGDTPADDYPHASTGWVAVAVSVLLTMFAGWRYI